MADWKIRGENGVKMNQKMKILIFNVCFILVSILFYSDAFLGLSFVNGTVLSKSFAYFFAIIGIPLFVRQNTKLLKKADVYTVNLNVYSLDECVKVLQETMAQGDAFDNRLLKNIEQINRFKRKKDTIRKTLLNKFTEDEMSFQRFQTVINEVENIVYCNTKSIINKISAFDIVEYEHLLRKNFPRDEVSDEKMAIYKEYFYFVDNAIRLNEEILLKMDKMLLEISRYNTLEGRDVQKLPALIEMDELIQNAKLYK